MVITSALVDDDKPSLQRLALTFLASCATVIVALMWAIVVGLQIDAQRRREQGTPDSEPSPDDDESELRKRALRE